MEIIAHLAILAVTILLLSRFVPSVRVESGGAAVAVAIVFSVLNFFLGTILTWVLGAILFVPALLTLGLLFLFLPFLVNTLLLWLTDKLIASFEIRTMGGLLLSSAVITVVNSFFYASYVHSAWVGPSHGGTGPRWI
jgi:putative membrane protein